jgi:hypothetical protein
LAVIAAQADEKQKLEDKKHRLEEEKRRLEHENSRLRRRLEQYEPEVRYESKHSKTGSKPGSMSYSLGAENKRRHPHRRHKKSSGRQATEVKVAIAQRTEDVYPDGVHHADCRLVRERAVWRLEDGKAILIGYRSVIVSVLESLRVNLENFTLANVLEEVTRWMREGISLFARQWQKIKDNSPVPEPNTS